MLLYTGVPEAAGHLDDAHLAGARVHPEEVEAREGEEDHKELGAIGDGERLLGIEIIMKSFI